MKPGSSSALICFALLPWSTLARPAAAQGTCSPFPILDVPGEEASVCSAFDGTNFFVAVQSPQPTRIVGGQLVSQAGAPVGPVITAGFFGDGPVVAYGAGQYLLVGENDTIPGPEDPVYGQFISTSGILGTLFPISVNPLWGHPLGVAFDDVHANFLVVYSREVNSVTHDDVILGRFVTPLGAVGSEIPISTGFGDYGLNNIACDGSRYLVVWVDDVDDAVVKGRFVSSPAGTLSAEFTINASPERSDSFTTVAFDGKNYLVVWPDQVGGAGSPEWDLRAQLVSTTGALVGGVVLVTTALHGQMWPFVAWDGTTYLVTWTDLRNDLNFNGACDSGEQTCADVYGQLVAPSGALVGSEIPIVTEAGDQMTSRVVSGGGRFLVTWTRGHLPSSGGTDGIYGTFVGPNGCPMLTPYCFGDGSGTACPCGNYGSPGNGCANSVRWEGGRLIGSGTPSVSTDTVILTGSNMPSSSALYFQGTAQTSSAFGDGLRCVSGTVIRLGTKTNSASGMSFYPDTAAGDSAISIRGLVPAGGGTRNYQVWYRNAASFCTPSGFNLTNGLSAVWSP